MAGTVKRPSRRAPIILQDAKIVLRRIFGSGNPAHRAGWWVVAMGTLLAVVCYFLADQRWLDYAATWWRTTPDRADLCGRISWYGDFFPYNLTIYVVLLAAGWMRGSRFLTRLAMTSLLAGALAGGVALTAKSLLGRPRPLTVLRHKAAGPDDFHGPFHGAAWESFPSGHTATSFGAAVPLVLAAPEIGVPVACLSLGIGGSRLAGLNHYPSDVIAGATLGLWFGLRAGWPLRLLRRRGRAHARAKCLPVAGQRLQDRLKP